MVRTREQARWRPQEPAINAARRRFAPPQFVDVPSAFESSQSMHGTSREKQHGFAPPVHSARQQPTLVQATYEPRSSGLMRHRQSSDDENPGRTTSRQ
ncbi:hypothetical protein V6N13_093170 [Hibiscus sabdariffa]